MNIRRARMHDLPAVCKIVKDATGSMDEQGR
jgi:hypothetical protein